MSKYYEVDSLFLQIEEFFLHPKRFLLKKAVSENMEHPSQM